MYDIRRSTRFRKDIKRCLKQGKDISKFQDIHETLVAGKQLRDEHKDHKLSGDRKNYRECHIEPDWLLIYRINDQKKEIEYIRTGSHSELFKK